jgi:hypothetical protein
MLAAIIDTKTEAGGPAPRQKSALPRIRRGVHGAERDQRREDDEQRRAGFTCGRDRAEIAAAGIDPRSPPSPPRGRGPSDMASAASDPTTLTSAVPRPAARWPGRTRVAVAQRVRRIRTPRASPSSSPIRHAARLRLGQLRVGGDDADGGVLAAAAGRGGQAERAASARRAAFHPDPRAPATSRRSWDR